MVATHIIGLVLAGGRSSRMGGGDKCLEPLGGKPLLGQHQADYVVGGCHGRTLERGGGSRHELRGTADFFRDG